MAGVQANPVHMIAVMKLFVSMFVSFPGADPTK
jgi:hypothetical protein